MNAVTVTCAIVIFAYSVWACLSHKYDDGIIGKLLFFAAALLSLALFLTGRNEQWLNVVFALLCLRCFCLHVVWPLIIKKYLTWTGGNMTAIEKAAALIRQFEGCRLTAYRCPAGIWTIGYGHTAGVTAGDVWTQEQADRALEQDIGKYRKAVLIACPALADYPNRLAACISLAYNIGTGAFASSSVARHINKGDYRAAADAFLLWVNAGGRKLEGLVKRRQAEQAIFLKY